MICSKLGGSDLECVFVRQMDGFGLGQTHRYRVSVCSWPGLSSSVQVQYPEDLIRSSSAGEVGTYKWI